MSSGSVRFDPYYVKTIPGILRLAQIGLGIIVLICCSSAQYQPDGTGFIYFVAVVSLLNSAITLLMYLLHVPDSVTGLPWVFGEMIYTAVWSILYFICGIIAAAGSAKSSYIVSNTHSAMGAASFFCFATLVVYAINCFWFFREWRSGPRPSMGPTTPGGMPPSMPPDPNASYPPTY